MNKIRRLIFVVPILFLVVSLLTLRDYGISWDEPIHFFRGQAYFNYFRTGDINYSEKMPLGSYFQNRSMSTGYWLINDGGHPPLNDILAAFTNYVFYQKLNIVSDINAHHLFNVFSSFLLVVVVAVFAFQTYGLFASIFSAMVIGTYPLFFAESHFNIKDPPMTAFFTLTIWLFWLSLKKKNWKILILSAVSCGAALGMKFNIVFLPIILIPYLLHRFWPFDPKRRKELKQLKRPYKLALIASPFVVVGIFVLMWPYLWQDPIVNFSNIFKYYKDIGVGTDYQYSFLTFAGINWYPAYWIAITTPPLVLVFTILGIVFSLFDKKSKEKTSLLFLFWFIAPILRVTWSKMSIYGGIRQIMEFLPAMALLAGFGADRLVNRLKFKVVNLKPWILTISFGILIVPLVRYHPNQNVYFNFLIGGLNGAKEKQIPYWGNSFGNAYWQAIKWINSNVEENAGLALIKGTSINVPTTMLRSDINFNNSLWSGIDREGEYLMELTHDDPVKYYFYAWDYVDRFLESVYEVKVDGVAIVKVWKNDLANTKENYKRPEKVLVGSRVKVLTEGNIIRLDFTQDREITRIKINYQSSSNCEVPKGKVEILSDQDEWIEKEEAIAYLQIASPFERNGFTYFFPADKTDGVRFIFNSLNSCALISPIIQVYALK